MTEILITQTQLSSYSVNYLTTDKKCLLSLPDAPSGQ